MKNSQFAIVNNNKFHSVGRKSRIVAGTWTLILLLAQQAERTWHTKELAKKKKNKKDVDEFCCVILKRWIYIYRWIVSYENAMVHYSTENKCRRMMLRWNNTMIGDKSMTWISTTTHLGDASTNDVGHFIFKEEIYEEKWELERKMHKLKSSEEFWVCNKNSSDCWASVIVWKCVCGCVQ